MGVVCEGGAAEDEDAVLFFFFFVRGVTSKVGEVDVWAGDVPWLCRL